MTQISNSSSTELAPSGLSSASMGSLAERLKLKTEQQASAIQAVTKSELDTLQQNLQDLSKSALNLTESAIADQVQKIQRILIGADNVLKKVMSQTGEQLTSQTERIGQTLSAKQVELQKSLDTSKEILDQANGQVQQSLAQTTEKLQEQLQHQQAAMQAAMSSQTKRILWLMKLPMIGLLTVCLLICGATWAWTAYRINQAEQHEAQTHQTIKHLTEAFCQTPAGKASCQPAK